MENNLVALVGLILAFLANMGALIWGAATLSTTVKYHGSQMEKVAGHVERVASLLSEVETRVSVLEHHTNVRSKP